MYFTWLIALCGVTVVRAGSITSDIAGELAGDVIYEIVK